MAVFPAQQNLARRSKWIAELPLNSLFTDVQSSIHLNLTKFIVPGVDLKPVETSYAGYTTSIPSRVQTPESREVNVEYILSSDYSQYILLQRWLNAAVTNEYINSDDNYEMTEAFENSVKMPIFVTLLSEFKTNIFRIKFHNCFLVKINDLELTYESQDDEVLKHGFTFAFTHYTFEI